jgi:hypothetical protein
LKDNLNPVRGRYGGFRDGARDPAGHERLDRRALLRFDVRRGGLVDLFRVRARVFLFAVRVYFRVPSAEHQPPRRRRFLLKVVVRGEPLVR